MKVAFVNSMRSLGGGERWITEVSDGLSERGHDVAIAARGGSRLAEWASDRGHSLLELPMRGDLDVVSILRLAAWLRTGGRNLVSVSVARAVRIGAVAARLAGVRAVVERRGLLFPLKRSAANRFIYARCVTRVIANCGAIRDSVIATGLVSPSRISVIVNGIDPGRMEGGGEGNVRAELGIAPNESVVAVIGRLVRDKGHEHALRAFAAVARKRPDARLLVVGSGKLEPELSDLADAVAPPGSVIFAGHREDIAAVLRASDLLLVSSLREGMPHVVLEAMVAGTPVVATSVAGIPEMIENGRHGLLVRPGSDQDLARAALRLLSDRSLGRRLAAEAGERVRSEFSLATMLDRVEECFAEEIEARRRDLET